VSLESELRDACSKRAHCQRLVAAYDLVLEDLDDWDSDEWRFVRERVEAMRADVVEEVERATKLVESLMESLP
jgi:hypothetical protein